MQIKNHLPCFQHYCPHLSQLLSKNHFHQWRFLKIKKPGQVSSATNQGVLPGNFKQNTVSAGGRVCVLAAVPGMARGVEHTFWRTSSLAPWPRGCSSASTMWGPAAGALLVRRSRKTFVKLQLFCSVVSVISYFTEQASEWPRVGTRLKFLVSDKGDSYWGAWIQMWLPEEWPEPDHHKAQIRKATF